MSDPDAPLGAFQLIPPDLAGRLLAAIAIFAIALLTGGTPCST